MKPAPPPADGEDRASRVGAALKRAYPPDAVADATLDRLIERLSKLERGKGK